ncbi:MAG TPA: ABC transporter permease [Opitutaceae bacterium]|nr:ABC transporter permease [Opitutaceae bacterium]
MRASFNRRLLDQTPTLLFAVALAGFGLSTPAFLTKENLLNIGVQAAPVGIVATGMTFVLLTGGVDLSVGAAMFVAAAVAGKLLLGGQSLALAATAMLGIGAIWGAINAVLIARSRIAAFIVTLAMLFIGRGFALWLTETRAMNLPDSFLRVGSARFAGIPAALWLLGLVAGAAQITLSFTPFGRQLHAVGQDQEAARKAGVNTKRILTWTYLLSGIAAALGAVTALGQLGAVTPKFGENYEFKAIAAAVLGGTSLFGGRGAVLPGTLIGALLIQSIENGLVLRNADPYFYPLITSAIIFVAICLDRVRSAILAKRTRRHIRVEATT